MSPSNDMGARNLWLIDHVLTTHPNGLVLEGSVLYTCEYVHHMMYLVCTSIFN